MALRYKLRMFGIPIADEDEINPAQIFCDNETVTKKSTLVESKLNKKIHLSHIIMCGGTLLLGSRVLRGSLVVKTYLIYSPRSSMIPHGITCLGIGPIDSANHTTIWFEWTV